MPPDGNRTEIKQKRFEMQMRFAAFPKIKLEKGEKT
jgi:hypothetical protein